MKANQQNNESLLLEIEELKAQLEEANTIIDAIRDGAVDALVLHKEGQAEIYSLESADYTYRVLIEKFGEGALSISEHGLILYCNDYFSKLIGIPASQIVGTFFDRYMDDPLAFEKLKENLGEGPNKGEIVLNGVERKIHAYVSLTDLHPNVEAFGVVVADLTEKIQHEADLVQYQNKLEMKVNELNLTNTNLEQFIHVISHDIKEPLRKILTYTSHLTTTKTDLFTDAEIKNLNVINSSALRLNSLVDDLVKYAFSASLDENIGEVDLNKILREVIDDLEITMQETHAEVTSGDLPVITASNVQMRQLFANLISNAIKYAKEGDPSRISITYSLIPNVDMVSGYTHCHKISISDNGIGMESSQLNKIFTIFQRLHLRNEYSGNGIGLAICKRIMENHHGRIEAESDLEEGSIFNLYFPVTE